ncbi:MAG: RNA polymerase-associated protein RapA [bacterium ADurb.Bin236]|nr:MAG: RNA polymerase-associated protein RapA [bacterium ADurb.Bin236]
MDGNWFFNLDFGQNCQVIETQTLWGETTCRVWLPGHNSVVRVPASRLKPLESAGSNSPDHIAYVATAARIADAMVHDVLLAPIESSVIPLPHQIKALSRAINGDRVRYLLADEVGLGKTIEAGLILKELKLRGVVKRILVIAPKGLVTQWVSEMSFHFGETFHLVLPDDLKSLNRVLSASISGDENSNNHKPMRSRENAWQMFSQVVVPMDSFKPLDKRRGWTTEQLDEYNRGRFEDLISANWDLVIVDEAHRLGGSTDQVARFKLGQGLSEAAPYILLLTATPHQGKTDAFHRLMSLIDEKAFPDVSSITRERVRPYVIRTEKRRAINADGGPLFKPRRTQLIPVSWNEKHRDQQIIYEAVTEYVREGYNQAIREKRSYIGFLMILMQRLVVSSTQAIKTTLEKRLDALQSPPEQLTLFPGLSDEEWSDMDGQEQIDTLLRTQLKALKNERSEVKLLLEATSRWERTGNDAKAEALLDWIYRLQAEENDSELKVLIFTEFIPTQDMLCQFLSERGFEVVCLNGSMGMDERKRVQESFAEKARILISTDAGGEGLNLQFCHVVINYDIPWNPMRIEQRIGRVDRIGQKRVVRAINFVIEDSVEHRVREVLEQKLAVIYEDFGVDKTSDVLDSAQAGRMFDELYVEAILNPERIEDSVDSVVARIQDEVRDVRSNTSILGTTEELNPEEAKRLMAHPLPHWIERLTLSYLSSHGGNAEKRGKTWNITWPDGEVYSNVVFSLKEVEMTPTGRYVTLEDTKVRSLIVQLNRFISGQPVPVVSIEGISKEIHGFWSLWSISIISEERQRKRILPLFISDDDKAFTPTARHIWDHLLATNPIISSLLDMDASIRTYERLLSMAEEQGKPVYEELIQEHRAHVSREREKSEYAFAAKRRAAERIGLPQVRNHRLELILQEERVFQEQLEHKMQVYPEISPLILIRVEGCDNE